jgi:hypothetical protein
VTSMSASCGSLASRVGGVKLDDDGLLFDVAKLPQPLLDCAVHAPQWLADAQRVGGFATNGDPTPVEGQRCASTQRRPAGTILNSESGHDAKACANLDPEVGALSSRPR